MAKSMNKSQAVLAIILDARRDSASISSFNRVLRACKVLNLSEAETNDVLWALDYHTEPGKPTDWVKRAMEPR